MSDGGRGRMDVIADALVFAVAHITLRPHGRSESAVCEDLGALEVLTATLSLATPDELDALAAAAERAEERAGPEFAHVYVRWMEGHCGVEWEGNRRIPAEDRQEGPT